MQISITTPVVSALKNCYVRGFLEVLSDILYHFWIQVAVLPLKPPRGHGRWSKATALLLKWVINHKYQVVLYSTAYIPSGK